MFDHTAEDDLESLFYVLVWICCLYGGPNNSPRQDRTFKETFCYNWAERAFEQDFLLSKLAKESFINQPRDDAMLADLHPYFKPIFGLLQKWRQTVRNAYANDRQVTYPQVHELLREAYKGLCDNGDASGVVDAEIPLRTTKKRRMDKLMGD